MPDSVVVRGVRVLLAGALSLSLVPLLPVETTAGLIRRATARHRQPPVALAYASPR